MLTENEKETLELRALLQGCVSLRDAVRRLEQTGMNQGRAIRYVAKLKPELYNTFRRQGGQTL